MAKIVIIQKSIKIFLFLISSDRYISLDSTKLALVIVFRIHSGLFLRTIFFKRWLYIVTSSCLPNPTLLTFFLSFFWVHHFHYPFLNNQKVSRVKEYLLRCCAKMSFFCPQIDCYFRVF